MDVEIRMHSSPFRYIVSETIGAGIEIHSNNNNNGSKWDLCRLYCLAVLSAPFPYRFSVYNAGWRNTVVD